MKTEKKKSNKEHSEYKKKYLEDTKDTSVNETIEAILTL